MKRIGVELLLEALEARGERRLRDEEGVGGARHASEPSNLDESLELP